MITTTDGSINQPLTKMGVHTGFISRALMLLVASLALGACTRERRSGHEHVTAPTSSTTPSRDADRDAGPGSSSPAITIVPVSDTLMSQAAAGGATIRALMTAAKPTIGKPYKWAGSDMTRGVDCSNYTWLLYRSIGVPYERYIRTKTLATLRDNAGFRQTTFADALPGDLLVYGYNDDSGEWHGHVVILVDKTGHLTGHKGLVLGAHGTPVSSVRFVTTPGFEQGWFREPEMRLLNVLRPVEPTGTP